MPQEMIIALRVIFVLFLFMIARTAWLHIKEKTKERRFIKRIQRKEGKPIIRKTLKGFRWE